MRTDAVVRLGILLLPVPGVVHASPITDFSVFGGSLTSLGSNVTINSGFVGSNNQVTTGAGSDSQLTVMGGGLFTGGNNLNNTLVASGDITFNGNVSLGSGSHAFGNIHSAGQVIVGDNSIVEGNITANQDVVIGQGALVKGAVDAGLASGNAVTLGANAQVVGTVTHIAGTAVVLGSAATIGANLTGSPVSPTTYVTTSIPAATVFGTDGTPDFALGSGSTLNLPAVGGPTYGDVLLGNNSFLNLTAGTYYFDRWVLGSGATINLDVTSGDILLFFTGATGDSSLGNNSVFNIIGGDASDVYAEFVTNNFTAGSGVTLRGTFFASGAGGDIALGDNDVVTGAVWARDQATLGQGTSVTYEPADYVAPIQPANGVPEPGSLALLGAGLLALRRRLALRARPSSGPDP